MHMSIHVYQRMEFLDNKDMHVLYHASGTSSYDVFIHSAWKFTADQREISRHRPSSGGHYRTRVELITVLLN